MEPRFIVDLNVGKLAKWLRILGYDASLFSDGADDVLLRQALRENRVVLTKDTHIFERRVVTTGRLKAVLIRYDDILSQLSQVVQELNLDSQGHEFSLCIECNQPLKLCSRRCVETRVPAYVLQTHQQFMECAHCRRLYWKGTHWQRMQSELQKLWNSVRS